MASLLVCGGFFDCGFLTQNIEEFSGWRIILRSEILEGCFGSRGYSEKAALMIVQVQHMSI